MRTLACLVLMLCACPQVEVLCTESDRCEPLEPPPPPPEADLATPAIPHFTPVALPANTPPLRAIGGTSAVVNSIYVVGNNATVLIGDGSSAFGKTAASPTPAGTLQGVFVAGPQDVWVADGSNSTVHHTTTGGSMWTNTVAGASAGLQGIFGKSATDILAVGQDSNEARHYNSGWAAARYSGPLKKQMFGVWASANNYYIVGSGAAVGKSSSPRTFFTDISIGGSSASLRGVFGMDDNNVFTVGAGGAVYKYDGSQWSAMPQGSTQLNAIWGSSAQDIWIVGDNGAAYHYDGAQWKNELTASLVSYHLTGVWGDGKGGVWAAATDATGSAGAVFKY